MHADGNVGGPSSYARGVQMALEWCFKVVSSQYTFLLPDESKQPPPTFVSLELESKR